ncbi:MAG: hypothetical protein ACKO2P_01055 [Planctomycetota bacterium]
MSTLGERLAKARAKLFGTAAADVPAPFQLPCTCGHIVAGIRRPCIQITLCSACGQSLFVLPADRYPPTRRTARTTSERTTDSSPPAATSDSVEPPKTQPEWASSESATTERTASAEKTARRSTRRTATSPSRPSSAPGTSPTEGSASSKPQTSTRPTPPPTPTLAPPRPSITVRIRRTFTPFRLLTAGCLALLILTAGWMLHQRQLENARRIWRREFDTALKAETEGNRTALQQALQQAIAAADLLQKQDSDVAHARSLLRQCQAISQLTAVDPVAILTTHSAPGQPTSPDTLTTELRGLMLLFDAIPQAAPEAPNGVLLDLPLVIHGHLLQLSVQSEILHRFAQLHPGQSALFTAAIRASSPAADSSGPLLLELDPDSITLLTSEFLAAEAGLSPDHVPELHGILQRQSSLMFPVASGPSSDTASKPNGSAKATTP